MRIKDIMSQPVVSCPLESTLDHAARLMWEFDCGVLPVIADDGRLAGVVTDRDICMAAYTQGKALSSIPVSVAMAANVVAVHEDDLVERGEELMRTHQVRRLPVLGPDERPIGLVGMNDVARLAAHVKRTAVDRELIKTLAAVSEPRAVKASLPADPGTITRPRLAG